MTEERWGSRIGVILAVMGSAIGLGNFLRFPGLAAQYEGGAFMIPYFISFLLLGLPIAWIEWSIGRYGGEKGFNSSPGIFRTIWHNRVSPYLGVFGLIVPVGIYMFYVFIEAWCLYYAFQYLTGTFPLGRDSAAYSGFFSSFLGIDGNGNFFTRNQGNIISFLIFCFFLNFFIIYRGLSRGIEVVSKYGIPTLFILAFVILIRVLTLGTPDPAYQERNVLNGLGFMWNPPADFGTLLVSLGNGQMWLEAAGQIFFSLSVGFGVIITYASYLRRKDDVILSGTSSASGNIFAEVALGGMITIPAAFIFLGPSLTVGSTFELGFVTLPVVFEYMPLGSVFGFLWFFLLFLAAVTSSLSMLQPAIAFFEEGLGVDRKASVTLLGFITMIGALFIAYFSESLMALDNMDFWIGTFSIFVLATIQVILAGWVFGADRIVEEARKGSLIRIPSWIAYLIKYVAPSYLIVIFGFWAYQSVPDYIQTFKDEPVARFTLFFIIILAGFFMTLIVTAVNRWKKLEKVGASAGTDLHIKSRRES